MSRNLTEEHLNAIAKRASLIEHDIDYCMACITVCEFYKKYRDLTPIYQRYIELRRRDRKEIRDVFARMVDFKKLKKHIYG